LRRLLVGIGSVLVAAALAAGSGANYQSSSANTGNIIKAGVVSVTNGSAGSAVLTVANLAPGKTATGSVTITNSGDLPALVAVRGSNIVDSPASPALSAKLNLTVEDVTASSTLYSGTLGGFTEVPAGSLPVAAAHTFRFTVSMPDGGLGAEDAYQGARTTLDLAFVLTADMTQTTTTTTTTATSTTSTTTTATTTTATTTTATTTTP
jgi:hypothetical protein